MKKQGGFTLIELVVVIVILGILAVTAAPKFLNLQDDAKVSAVKGLAGAMKGAAGITYGKAAVRGVDALPSTDSAAELTDIDGVSGAVKLAYGYPVAGSDGIEKVVDGLDTDDWAKDVSGANTYGYAGFDCVVKYTEATADDIAKIEVLGSVDGCESMNAN
ncbi:type II secretion system protein [Vibrio litoralis]|uniref:type II secretion system protein n=1 Tax=Vibrio litoralis TaxID=335972 RepID=UPI001866F27F|nr:type II secretion system protein [Vibrio litoralis]